MTGVGWASVPRVMACLWAACLTLNLIWSCGVSQASIYRHSGPCVQKDRLLKPGQTFHRGCDKCFCHDNGFVCFSLKKPTSWPRKCQRVPTECGYRVVYRENPKLECRAYSWVG